MNRDGLTEWRGPGEAAVRVAGDVHPWCVRFRDVPGAVHRYDVVVGGRPVGVGDDVFAVAAGGGDGGVRADAGGVGGVGEGVDVGGDPPGGGVAVEQGAGLGADGEPAQFGVADHVADGLDRDRSDAG